MATEPPGKKRKSEPRKRAAASIRTPDSPTSKRSSGRFQKKKGFPIVGIGASAGGLEAFEQFFTHAPPDTGMAFVLVQHLDPTHKSILVELVRRYTRMKVFEIEDGMEVQPDCTYIIPPNRDMAILQGVLHLIEPVAPRGQRMPIDYFFRSLAQDQQEMAVAIVLSGTGSDGQLGIKAIKGEGGMVMIQAPESARYDGMPRSALNTGVGDYVLAPEEMAGQLMAYVELAVSKNFKKKALPLNTSEDDLKKIFILVRSQTGHDFSLYKDNTIMRRIERRMSINQISEMRLYVRYLQQNPLEVETLFKEILIGVTSFFRDPEAFDALKAKVIPVIFQERPRNKPVRIWIPGCSTGEEAYSIAILIRNYMESNRLEHDVQIFATDIDGEAIESARQGKYPDSIAMDVPSVYLKHYFSHTDSTLQVEQSLRDIMVFATQSITKDPPFSKIDLLSCRNVLIYMSPKLQARVLPLFHYALNPEGFLFLGHSESLNESAKSFVEIDRRWKIFRSKGGANLGLPQMGFPPARTDLDVDNYRLATAARDGQRISYRDLTEKFLLRDHTPAAVLVDENNNTLFIHGSTGEYLEPARGEANLSLLAMARQGLKLDLTTALRKARNQKRDVRVEGVQIGKDRAARRVDITIRVVSQPPSVRGLLLVLFEPHELLEQAGSNLNPIVANASVDDRVREVEHELAATQEHLQTTIEELETSNEELTSTNEELQSSNEELQSTNEELETSKEELQSVNEELMTVNSELETKVHQLSEANNDMNNLLEATKIATLFLDVELNIKRFTPSVTEVIKLIQSDLDRPLSDIAYDLGGVNLCQRSSQVLGMLTPHEQQVQTSDRRQYLLRILPYRTTRNVIDGVVITFVNITAQWRAEKLLNQFIENSQIPKVMCDRTSKIVEVNQQAEILFGWSESELKGQSTEYLVPESRRLQYRALLNGYMKSPFPMIVEEAEALPNLRKDGSEFSSTIGLAPIDDNRTVMIAYFQGGD